MGRARGATAVNHSAPSDRPRPRLAAPADQTPRDAALSGLETAANGRAAAARARLRHLPDPQAPARNARSREDAGLCPGIVGETQFDFVFVLRAEDEKNVFPSLQPASEADEPLGLERVHEHRVSLPILLLFERQAPCVGWTIAPNDHK